MIECGGAKAVDWGLAVPRPDRSQSRPGPWLHPQMQRTPKPILISTQTKNTDRPLACPCTNVFCHDSQSGRHAGSAWLARLFPFGLRPCRLPFRWLASLALFVLLRRFSLDLFTSSPLHPSISPSLSFLHRTERLSILPGLSPQLPSFGKQAASHLDCIRTIDPPDPIDTAAKPSRSK